MININRLNQNNNYNLGNPKIDRDYSTFTMRETNQSTGKVGKMIPFLFHEVQPSETFRCNTVANIEFTPWITNILHEINAEITYNFVPYRIIWDDWKKFITRCDEENDETSGTLEIPIPNYEMLDLAYWAIKMHYISTSKPSYDINDLSRGIWFYERNDNNIDVGDTLWKEIWAKVKDLAQQEQITEANARLFIAQILSLTFRGIYYGTLQTFNNYQPVGRILSELYIKSMTESIFDYAGIAIAGDYSEVNAVQQWTIGAYWLFDLVEKKNLNLPISETDYGQRGRKAYFVNKLNFWAYNKIYNDWVRLLDWEEKRDKNDLSCATDNKAWDIYTKMRRYQIRGAMPTVPINIDPVKIATGMANGTQSTDLDITNLTNDYQIRSKNGATVTGNVNIKKEIDVEAEWEIQSMMSAAALMNYFVSNAKVKPRYAEQLLARWGVAIQDSRFQYAQLIGTGRIQITQDGVTQTAPQVGESTLQGNITGQGWGHGTADTKFYAPEHGVIIGIITVKPSNVYELGIQKQWQHENTFDYPTPEFVNLPDQPIKGLELSIATWQTYEPSEISLGYKSIYDEYRTKVNRVTGLLRPSQMSGLKAHTLAINYSRALQTDRNGFIKHLVKAEFPMERIKQFTDQPDFLFITATNINSTQPLPVINDVRIRI